LPSSSATATSHTAEQCEAAAHKIRSSNPDRDLNDLVDPKGVYVAASCEPEKKASGIGH
jgi:hypothetical protein